MSARRPPQKYEGPRIAALGGGTGLPAVLRALRIVVGPSAPADAITAVVAVTDDGGSSGQLRQQLQVLPPGDVRNCVAALADDASPLAPLLQHRFAIGSGLGGHPVGNLMLAALTQQLGGDFASAVDHLGRIAGISGRVLPATADDVHLEAEYTTGEVIVGESAIASRRLPIKRLALQRHVRPLPDVIAAIVNADAIIVGPGSLYTSILPVLLVDGIAATISGLTIPRIYVANLMTEPGETDGFTLDDHLAVIRQHTGSDLFDYVLVNRHPLAPDLVSRYGANGSVPVNGYERLTNAGAARLIECDLAADDAGGKIRHEPLSLAAALRSVLPNKHASAPEEAIA
ncbi:MAG TPA: gluconeogenesis factor YvcK family protein [Vicinamibacterales bacterium]|nr:gluconeogenesis factor YvcK family protein [Vicinamibacterales bacterium]